MRDAYVTQVELLLRCLPQIGKETCFAIKGGTGINLFLLDMPRLSVDVDLAYIPVAPRKESLSAIVAAMRRIKKGIESTVTGARAEVIPSNEMEVARLIVRRGDAHIKVEPNTVLRGSVFEPESMELCPSAQEKFELFVTCQVLSRADLYGGKICSALDRQHPRDFFDMKVLLDGDGLDHNVRRSFIVYLSSHNRTMHEMLAPIRKDIRPAYESSFVGMMDEPPSVEKLEELREALIQAINEGLNDDEREFLLSLKRGEPKWDLLGLAHVEKLPAIQWKLLNLQRMEKNKHRAALVALEKVLGR